MTNLERLLFLSIVLPKKTQKLIREGKLRIIKPDAAIHPAQEREIMNNHTKITVSKIIYNNQ